MNILEELGAVPAVCVVLLHPVSRPRPGAQPSHQGLGSLARVQLHWARHGSARVLKASTETHSRTHHVCALEITNTAATEISYTMSVLWK